MEKQPQEAMSNDERGRGLLRGIVLRCARTLQRALPINEATFRGVIGSACQNSRAFYLYGVLDEVLKVGTIMLTWEGFLKESDKTELEKILQNEDGPHMLRVTREAFMDEQHLWSRKLIELLSDLILFETTNSQEYYRLFLTCEILDAYLGLQRDFTEFFGGQNLNAGESIKLFLSTAKQSRRSINFTEAWFLNTSTNWERPIRAGNLFCSTRARYKLALQRANTNQKIALGISYENAYATPSRSIHANIGGPSLETSQKIMQVTSGHVIILAMEIILQAHKLAEIPLTGEAEFVDKLVKTHADSTEAFNSVTGKALEVGDIVFAYAKDLCVVIDKNKSVYGYSSYKVRYLSKPPLPEVPEDWYPAKYVHLVCPHKQVRENLIHILKTHFPTRVENIRTMDDKELVNMLAKAALEMYENGVIDLFLKQYAGSHKSSGNPTR